MVMKQQPLSRQEQPQHDQPIRNMDTNDDNINNNNNNNNDGGGNTCHDDDDDDDDDDDENINNTTTSSSSSSSSNNDRRRQQQQQQQQQPAITMIGLSPTRVSIVDYNVTTDSVELQTPFALLPSSTNRDNNNNNNTTTTSRRIQNHHQQPNDESRLCSSSTATETVVTELGGKASALLETIPQRTNWATSTLSIPDIDDLSMNYTFLYMEHYKVDLFWSMLSDSFFILGGISYILLSAWDYSIYHNNNRNSSSDDITNINHWYVTVDLIAPTVYLINSIIDIHWAEAVRLRLINKQDMTKIWDEARYQLRGLSFSSSSLPSTYDYSNEEDVQFCLGCTWCYRMRKYAAHRRTMMAAFSFGVAASLAVVATLLRNFFVPTLQSEFENIHEVGPWAYSVDSILDALSDHVYIVSAVFSMTGKRHRPWLAPSDPHTNLYNDSERLEDLGDLLFLIGSLMDATLSDLRLKHLVLLPILSSILWMFDGCLYMRSDIVKAYKLRDEAKAFNNDAHPIKFIV